MIKKLIRTIALIAPIFAVISIVYADNVKYAEHNTISKEHRVAIFAGGCFWCTEADFEKVKGVHEAVSGYIGGTTKNPSYKQVASGKTRHIEAVKVYYDESQVSYNELLNAYWMHVNPTDSGGQFVDRGKQYRPVIFYSNEQQKALAEKSKRRLDNSNQFNKPITVEITKAGKFWEAEEYHQDYYKKNPLRYKFYRYNSGRDQFLEAAWEENKLNTNVNAKYAIPSKDELKKILTPLQFEVTQNDGTERAFDNLYWDNKETGIYVDIVSGEPLFSSTDKFESGTGWPSFTKPLAGENITEHTDRKFFMTRTEVRSKNADSHLGHVFNDGPAPTGLRYCINSAALKFIAYDELAEKGYGDYIAIFDK